MKEPTWQSDDRAVQLYLGDCAQLLAAIGPVDALVTDPPYGIGLAGNPIRQKFDRQEWDDVPASDEAISLAVSISKEAIIWGGNYFTLPPSKGWLVWDKKQPEDFTLAMAELAWTNIDRPVKTFRMHPTSYEKFHPTQKPVELMAWCLKYVPAADSILDPFMGSGTTGIACIRLGRKFVGIEKDPAHFETAKARIIAALEAERTNLFREQIDTERQQFKQAALFEDEL